MDHPHQRRKLVAIAPAQEAEGANATNPDGQHNGPADPLSSKTKRSMTLVACDGCRRRRVKCDGHRPGCGQCVRKSDECVYAAAEGETLVLSLKKKHNLLEGEHGKYKELLTLLRTKPEAEAQEILRRIRETDEALVVIDEIRRADRLVAEPWLICESDSRDDGLLQLDQEAYGYGDFDASAELWTVVPDQDEFMSELTAEYLA